MTGERTMQAAVTAGPSPFEQATASEDRVGGVDSRVDVLPRRPIRDRGRVADQGSATIVERKADQTTVDYSEFRELASSIRRWLALSRAKGIPDATRADHPDHPDLRVLRDTVPYASWQDGQDREDAILPDRPALLIDAEHLTSERLPHLLETVRAAYGSPVICRAYADWTKPGLASWFAPLRHCGVQPIHHFDTPDHSRSLVALALEALDIVDRYAVTSLVLVGDLGAALPLVTRLKAAGVKVAVIGPASNPADVRRDADEFLNIDALSDPGVNTARGRHQA